MNRFRQSPKLEVRSSERAWGVPERVNFAVGRQSPRGPDKRLNPVLKNFPRHASRYRGISVIRRMMVLPPNLRKNLVAGPLTVAPSRPVVVAALKLRERVKAALKQVSLDWRY